jgi:hypothetical protein
MKVHSPKRNIFWISVVFAGLGVLGTFADLPVVSDGQDAFWFVVIGYGLLFWGVTQKGF